MRKTFGPRLSIRMLDPMASVTSMVSDTPCKLNTPSHYSLHQRSKILINYRSLNLSETAAVRSKCHRLILQITFSSLITNWTIQWMIHQRKLHHPFSSLLCYRSISLNFHARHGRHGAGGDWLRRLLNLHKAHTAITRDRQPAVVAESRDINAGDLTGLQYNKFLGDLDGVSIDEDFDGIFEIREVDTGV
ncbi:hypothetical protein ACFXTO_019101 [Malus domestica]